MMDYICKTPVLLIFFNRPNTLVKVFEQVRKAQPKDIILVQDGPRNDKDKELIMQCRSIVENVDWECNVVKEYSDVNLGCGVRPYTGIKKALTLFESVIILEDDCIPSESFFRYCDEMLEKYKDDERIAYISGLNHFETWDCGDIDYFFAKTGAIWSWATWRRSFLKYYDYYVKSITDKRLVQLIKYQIPNKAVAKSKIEVWRKAHDSANNGEKLTFWDVQWGFVKYSQNMLVIIPSKNLCCNIGVGATSTHAGGIKENKYIKYKNFNFIPTYKFDFPLREPQAVICDEEYDRLVYKVMAGNPIRRFLAKMINECRKQRRKQ